MTIVIGADMWFPPSQLVIDSLKLLEGFGFLGGYVGGPDLYENTPWPKTSWDLVKANNIKPLPIYVPKQDCSQNPIDAANDAMANCLTVGLTGLVAIDSEESMSTISNHNQWLEACYNEIHSNHWWPVNYAGAHYVTSSAYHWAVDWGMVEEIPVSGEAIQTGPYTLRDIHGNVLQRVDADIADSNFPFAEWVEPNKPTPPITLGEDVPHIEFDLDKKQQLFYVDAQGNMRHFYFSNGAWVDDGTHGTGWSTTGYLTQYVDSDGVCVVWGVMANGSMGQLYYTNNKWVLHTLG